MSSGGSNPGRTAAGSMFQKVALIVPVVSGTSTSSACGVTTTYPRSPATSGMSVRTASCAALEENPWRSTISGEGAVPS